MTPDEIHQWEKKFAQEIERLKQERADRKTSDAARTKLVVQKMEQARQLLEECRVLMSMNEVPEEQAPATWEELAEREAAKLNALSDN